MKHMINKPEVIEDYVINYEKYKMNKENEEENFEDLLIERRKHLCNFQEKSNTNINKINEELIKIDIVDKNIDKIENNNMIEIDNSYDDINNSENIKINKIVSDLAKNYEKNINVKKENEEDKIIADD